MPCLSQSWWTAVAGPTLSREMYTMFEPELVWARRRQRL